MNPRDIEKMVVADGWIHKSTKGSHKHFVHPTKPGKITIPQHKKELDVKTANSILKQAGLK